MRLRYFTQAHVEELRVAIGPNLDWYYSPSEQEFPVRPPPQSWREAGIQVEPLAPHLQHGRDYDADNALSVYQSLSGLTPQQAGDERFWVHVSHFDCAAYIADRWLGDRPEDSDQAVQKVRNHFFCRDTRALIRDHGVSRLWWLGHIAHKVHPDEPSRFLEIVLHRQDVRSALIERPSVSMNRGVLKGIFSIMNEEWEREGDKAELFQRDPFRRWMVALNRRGGVVLLDALTDAALHRTLREEAERAV